MRRSSDLHTGECPKVRLRIRKLAIAYDKAEADGGPDIRWTNPAYFHNGGAGWALLRSQIRRSALLCLFLPKQTSLPGCQRG